MKHSEESDEIKKRLIKDLKEKGYKLTPQRTAIINILSKEKIHPRALDIFKKARKKVPQISMSTVYYTLDILKKKGLICELEFYDMDNRYDVNVSSHLNLICTKCGKIEDFNEEPPISSQAVQDKTGFQPFQMRFEYYGYCQECSHRQKK